MHDTLMTLGIVCTVLAAGLFIASIAMFFGFRIPTVWKDSKGTLEQKQIDEIRAMRNNSNRRSGVNVFEELEKQAKPRRTGSQNLKLKTTASVNTGPEYKKLNDGTVVLKKTAKAISPDFIIEKDITFVSTSEVV